jgi:hypothetical protein
MYSSIKTFEPAGSSALRVSTTGNPEEPVHQGVVDEFKLYRILFAKTKPRRADP